MRHGMSKTRIYSVWCSMINRCTNPKASRYARYGGRGIKVCKRWQKFVNFYADMGDGQKGLTLERIDNDKGYSKGNCCWATRKQQQENTSHAVLLSFQNETHTRSEWERRLGLGDGTISRRLKHGEVPPYAMRPADPTYSAMARMSVILRKRAP